MNSRPARHPQPDPTPTPPPFSAPLTAFPPCQTTRRPFWNHAPTSTHPPTTCPTPAPPPRPTHRLAELARNAALLPRVVAPQHVLAAEARADGPLLKGVLRVGMDGLWSAGWSVAWCLGEWKECREMRTLDGTVSSRRLSGGLTTITRCAACLAPAGLAAGATRGLNTPRPAAPAAQAHSRPRGRPPPAQRHPPPHPMNPTPTPGQPDSR